MSKKILMCSNYFENLCMTPEWLKSVPYIFHKTQIRHGGSMAVGQASFITRCKNITNSKYLPFLLSLFPFTPSLAMPDKTFYNHAPLYWMCIQKCLSQKYFHDFNWSNGTVMQY